MPKTCAVFFKKRIFNAAQKEQIVSAIRDAEKLTSGEIKVHVEPKCTGDAMHRALQIFHQLGIHKTTHKNGVLIYLATEDRRFAVLGDSGIHAKVPANFWDGTKEVMKAHFKKGELVEGILFAIRETGSHLAQYFPPSADDKNELSDDISEG